ncbi:type II toxin-antitoxin system PemK/MazF family toxin [Limosilactobacillus pontis]|uniref:type II toxin-antitoxin system PemK/MazF family toxin n=1 Tax=Limosilactobacillus pontis TaxID=35787 RepID=UPI002AFE0661|nr:type II toxin-antitoxin system PemK/MazF family toxin [Limosilactobacillus pontis]
MVMIPDLSMQRLTMTNYKTQYIPDRQDLIWINFKPSVGQEIRGRHPAIVISSANYSRLTGLVMVMPITHAANNRLKSLFIPLQTYSLVLKNVMLNLLVK